MKKILLFLPLLIFADYLDDYQKALKDCSDEICKEKISILSFYKEQDAKFSQNLSNFASKISDLNSSKVFYLDKNIFEIKDEKNANYKSEIDRLWQDKTQKIHPKNSDFFINLDRNFMEFCSEISAKSENFCYIKAENLIFYSNEVIKLLQGIEISKKLCANKNAKSCFLVGVGLKKFAPTIKEEFDLILHYYKKSCDLGYDFGCEVRKFREKCWSNF